MTFFDAHSEPVATKVLAALAKVALVQRTHAWQDAGPRGLTPTQTQALAALARGPLRLGELAEQLGVSAPTASDAVAALVAKRLLAKKPAADDARARVLTLTAKGRKAARETSTWPDALAATVASLSEEEQAVFLRALTKMIRGLQEQGQIPIQRMCVTCRFFRPDAHPADPERPHHCSLVDAPFGERHLRLDCPEHQLEETP